MVETAVLTIHRRTQDRQGAAGCRKWSKDTGERHRERTGKALGKQYPLSIIRAAVTQAYPLLAELRSSEERPPIWAELMYLESEAVLRTMLALKEEGVPSLSVHDSLIVPVSHEERARKMLVDIYAATTTATPQVTLKQ
jgi:hypothetical protein